MVTEIAQDEQPSRLTHSPALQRLQRLANGLALDTAEGFDKAFVRMAFHGRRLGLKATRQSVISRVESAGRYYDRMDQEGRLFPTPPPANLVEQGVHALVGGRAVDARWPSAWRGLDASHRRTLDRCRHNALCHARWYRHDKPAPMLICLHGWGVGYSRIEERNFAARWFYEKGLDVVLFTLPFHAQRAEPGRLRPMFPTVDPVRTNEGFAQAIHDLRGFITTALRRGASHVGVTGMSLGGFTSALLATTEPRLSFAIPQIPFPSIAELLLDHMADSPTAQLARSRGLDDDTFLHALKATTPSERAAAMPPENILILAGLRDRVTPLAHAERLHKHFEGSRLITFPGAHVMQIGRSRLSGEMLRFIAGCGVPIVAPGQAGLLG